MKNIYLRVYTVEIGMILEILWEVVPARTYFADRQGREVRMKAGETLCVAFQSRLQHDVDPLSQNILEQVCRIHISGAFVTYRVDLRSSTHGSPTTLIEGGAQ